MRLLLGGGGACRTSLTLYTSVELPSPTLSVKVLVQFSPFAGDTRTETHVTSWQIWQTAAPASCSFISLPVWSMMLPGPGGGQAQNVPLSLLLISCFTLEKIILENGSNIFDLRTL